MLKIGIPKVHLTRLLFTLTLLALSSTPAPADPVNLVGVPGIVDGDTIRVAGTRIRLIGIDAPEMHQSCARVDGGRWACGQEAARRLQAFIAGRQASCLGDSVDRYGRLLAACTVGGINIGAWMVRSGWAVAYQRYSEQYVPDEEAARNAKVGIWDGQFDWPWEWRKNHR